MYAILIDVYNIPTFSDSTPGKESWHLISVQYPKLQ